MHSRDQASVWRKIRMEVMITSRATEKPSARAPSPGDSFREVHMDHSVKAKANYRGVQGEEDGKEQSRQTDVSCVRGRNKQAGQCGNTSGHQQIYQGDHPEGRDRSPEWPP